MALGTNLPTWPALVFTYIEPITTLVGCYAALSDPTSFTTRQLPVASVAPIPSTAIIVTQSLGSAFLLFALLNILCTAVTRDVKVTKYYLVILACGDIGHLYANYTGMGSDVFWNFGGYNDMMVGNVGFTVFLWVNRILTLAGVFGKAGRRG